MNKLRMLLNGLQVAGFMLDPKFKSWLFRFFLTWQIHVISDLQHGFISLLVIQQTLLPSYFKRFFE